MNMMAAVGSRKRRATVLFLIEKYEEDIRGLKLPSNRQALGYFLYLHQEKKDTTREASGKTICKIEEFWNRARIPVRHKQDSIKKLESLFARWQALKKNASRKTETQAKREVEFKECFEDLFDIAHANALEIIDIEEDKAFLLAQREKGRRGAMYSVDNILTKKEKKRQERLAKEMERRQKAIKDTKYLEDKVSLESSSSSSTSSISTVDEFWDGRDQDSSQSFITPPLPKRGRKMVMTPALAATLDRNKVSDRAALMIVGETASTLGHNISTLTLNRTSIRRQRQEHRKATTTKIQGSFKPETTLIVHWDGKLLKDITSKAKVDRLPILVSSLNGDSQLLAVPKIPASTGVAQAHAVFNVLKEWKLEDKVQGMCFDTTSSNTGRKMGACVILKQLLGRDLLHLACRHHILELVAGAAFTEAMGAASSAPEILLFKRFQGHWNLIDQNRFDDSSTDQLATEGIADIKEELVIFFKTALMKKQPRDDYREILELALIFLGTPPPRGTRFTAPGAMHKARWMSKIIYTFKVWMFRAQFHITAREEKGLCNLCIFFARVYVKAWTTAPLPVKAPHDDLLLLQSLLAYNSINASISKAASLKFANHMWYLSEELVGLSLFDDNVSHDIKDLMVKAMSEVKGDEDPAKRVQLHASLSALKGKTVADFTTKNTRSLLSKLDLPQGFLLIPSSQWEENEDYQTSLAKIKTLAVINDHAERGVALVQDLSGILTKDENQLQFLLQVVADHRKRYPQALKRTLSVHTDSNNC